MKVRNVQKVLDRRQFLSSTSLALLGLAGTGLAHGQAWPGKPEETIVETTHGRVRGSRRADLVTFKGIPYGGSVAGQNRFKAAPPLQPWTGVRDALRLGNPAIQGPRVYLGVDEPAQAEDCLYLNVWTPAIDGAKRPVMFYNHGGGFVLGSGGTWYQDGGNLARNHDVVTVSSNHRLGLLGFLFLAEVAGEEYASSGNQGMLDILQALRWVKENIAGFGGDPDNVMVFGESGGGQKTSCIYAMPSAKNYFNKASIESGAGIRMATRESAAATTSLVLEDLGLSNSEWRNLLEVPVPTLLETNGRVLKKISAAPSSTGGMARPSSFMPVVDGVILPHHPFDPVAPEISREKPLLLGSNRDEAAYGLYESGNTAAFLLNEEQLKQRLESRYGDNSRQILSVYRRSRPGATPSQLYIAIAGSGTALGEITIAERKCAQHGAAAYMYVFVHPSNFIVPGTNYPIGAGHSLEIPYKFDNIHAEVAPNSKAPGPYEHLLGMETVYGTDPERDKTAHTMSEMWATFARTGHPGAKGQPNWPAYTPEVRATMMIDATCRVVNDPWGEERKLWRGLST
jgi:para-nitrobenzyl esterase